MSLMNCKEWNCRRTDDETSFPLFETQKWQLSARRMLEPRHISCKRTSMKLHTGSHMDHQQYPSCTSFWSLRSLSPFATATYLSCALDSTVKCYNSLQSRLTEIEKDIVAAHSSKEKRKLKRIRYHVNRDIRLCCNELETLMGAMDSAYLKMDVQYQQELEHHRNSWIPPQQYLNASTFPAYGYSAFPAIPALWQHQRTSWGPIPYNYDPYAAVAPQYAIQEAFMRCQLSCPTFQYPCSDQSISSPLLYAPSPTAVERFSPAPEWQYSTVQDLTKSMSDLSNIPPSPLMTNSSVATKSSKIEDETSTACSPEEPSLDDTRLLPPRRRYSSTAIDLLLYRFRTSKKNSCHRRVHTSEPNANGRGGSIQVMASSW
jgi:hypothetical protein